MPSADQDMVQQKPLLTGAGIGSSAAAGNESAVSYEATQRLSIQSIHQSSTCSTHLKTYFVQTLTTLVDRRAPLKCGMCMELPSKDYSVESREVKIEVYKEKPGTCYLN